MDQINHLFNVSVDYSLKQNINPAKPLSDTDKKCGNIFKSFLLGFVMGASLGGGAGVGFAAATGGTGFIAVPLLTTTGAVLGGMIGVISHLFNEVIIKNKEKNKNDNDISVKVPQMAMQNQVSQEEKMKEKVVDFIIHPQGAIEESFPLDLQRGSYKVGGEEFGVSSTSSLETDQAIKNVNKIKEKITNNVEIGEVTPQMMLNIMSFGGQKITTEMLNALNEDHQVYDKDFNLTEKYKKILEKHNGAFGAYNVPEKFDTEIKFEGEKMIYQVKADFGFSVPSFYGNEPTIDHLISSVLELSTPLTALNKKYDESNQDELSKAMDVKLTFSEEKPVKN